jgi:hypothetical protein
MWVSAVSLYCEVASLNMSDSSFNLISLSNGVYLC